MGPFHGFGAVLGDAVSIPIAKGNVQLGLLIAVLGLGAEGGHVYLVICEQTGESDQR